MPTTLGCLVSLTSSDNRQHPVPHAHCADVCPPCRKHCRSPRRLRSRSGNLRHPRTDRKHQADARCLGPFQDVGQVLRPCLRNQDGNGCRRHEDAHAFAVFRLRIHIAREDRCGRRQCRSWHQSRFAKSAKLPCVFRHRQKIQQLGCRYAARKAGSECRRGATPLPSHKAPFPCGPDRSFSAPKAPARRNSGWHRPPPSRSHPWPWLMA